MSRIQAMPAEPLSTPDQHEDKASFFQHEIVAATVEVTDATQAVTNKAAAADAEFLTDAMQDPVDPRRDDAAQDDAAAPTLEPSVDMAPNSEAEIAALAMLNNLKYASARVAAAKRLGINRGDLDRLVQVVRKKDKASRVAAARAAPLPKSGGVRWPIGVKIEDDGLYYEASKDDAPVWLSSRFDVLGEARRLDGTGWGLALRWCDSDGRLVVWVMPRRLLIMAPAEVEGRLVDQGLLISQDFMARQQFRKALGEVRSGTTVTIVDRAGWHATAGSPQAYVLPDGETLGETGEDLMMTGSGEEASRRCSTAGTLSGWRAGVAAKAAGNPLAVFAMACAFAGPLLLPLREVSGGFHLAGGSKGGKTTACKAAATVWGPPHKGAVLRDWHSTDNAVEAMAEEAGDGLLILDEIHQANPQTVIGTIYSLAGEGGKSRLKEDTTARRRRTWRILVLSNGEIDLVNVAAKAGQNLPAGAAVRLPSIPVDKGGEAWPDLHGSGDFAGFMGELHAAMQAHHGHAARAFIARLTHEWAAGKEHLLAHFEIVRAELTLRLPKDAEAQTRDVARRFALVAMAGELATSWGVTGWRVGETTRAVDLQMQRWLATQGGGAAEDAEAIERVRLLIAEHGESRFPASDENGSVRIDGHHLAVRRAGFRKLVDGEPCYLIFPEIWRREVFVAADSSAAAKVLRQLGYLVPGENGKSQRKERVPGLPQPTRFYVIRASIMGSD
jgi:putative DNA primase/helicase